MKQIKEKTILMKYTEAIMGVSIEELLHKMYIEEGKSIREISNIIGIHYHTVNTWLKQAKIDTRLPHEKLLELIEIRKKLDKENKQDE